MIAAVVAPDAVAWGESGLVPAIVQDDRDGRILMLAWVDAEALAATFETGEVHFHSRSRGRLWRKGEESGNVLRLRSVSLDCDGDALLFTVDPVGPTCHRGTRSCFDPASAVGADLAPRGQGFAWLERLWTTVEGRAAERPGGSYTVKLLDGGVDAVGRKVTEEATEVLLAAKDHAARPDDAHAQALSGEVADLLFHTFVLLAERGIVPAEPLRVLRERHAG
jgi:phosphoribosyl-ATP pyrophosphohydrolase/phosphoribosyl-AMP cyclohydrolase